jgi:hypothetical protein
VEPLGNQLLAENDSLVFSEDAELVKKWSTVMGATYDIKIAKVVKSGSQGGLGICMESTAQLDDMGQPQVPRVVWEYVWRAQLNWTIWDSHRRGARGIS